MISPTETTFKDTEIGIIPEEWDIRPLGELCEKIGGIQTGPFGSQLHNRDYVDNGTPIITVEHLGENYILHENMPKVSEKDRLRLNKYSLAEGDIVFSRVGSVDRRAIVKNAENGWLFSGRCLRVRVNREVMNPSFLSYYFGQERFKERVRAIAVGATMPSLNTDLLSKMKVVVPLVVEQDAIACILESLDGKISLNQQMNKVLEAICKVIFKHWFIDFEFPNEEGKPYKSSGGGMVYHEDIQMDIPQGWHSGTLSEISKITMGQSPLGNTYNAVGEGTPFYQGVRDFGTRFPTRRIFCTSPTRFAENGDILLSVRAPVGRLNIANEKCCIGRGLAGIRHIKNYQGYLYTLLSSTQGKWNIFEAEGTVFGAATKSNVEHYSILIPPESLQRMYDLQIEYIHEKLRLTEEQSRNLSQIRDSLLSKLMSGKIRVPVEGKQGC